MNATTRARSPEAAGPSRSARLVFIAAVIAGASYLASDAAALSGLVVPAWKASGIVLLAGYAAMHRAWALAAALIASAVGDVMLALEPEQTLAGIAAFATAHLIYVAIFIARIRANGLRRVGFFIVALLAVHGAVMYLALAPHLGEMTGPVAAYTSIILAMASLAAIARTHWLALAGAILFVVSDTVLSARMFADALPWAGPLVWATYFGGQALLTLGLTARRDQAGSSSAARGPVVSESTT